MNTDEKGTNDRASAGDTSSGQSSDTEEIIDLVDEVPQDDDSSELEQAPEVESQTEEDDEELIELTDVVEESPSEPQIGDTALEGGAEEIVEAEVEQGPEEEEPIDLTGEVLPEVDSAQEQEEIVELGDLTEEPGLDAEEAELAELSGAETSTPEPEEDSLIDDLGLEMSEEGPEIPVEEGPADEDLATPEEDEESLLDTVESQPEAEDQSKLGSAEDVPEPVGGALEQAALEKLSDEKLEEIVTRIAKQTIEGKVERILLEAAEAAIAKEIGRLKQAL
jgi:pilus assembly protein FimV